MRPMRFKALPVLVGYSLLAAFVSLWPFDFFGGCSACPNGARLLGHADGLDFESPGIVRTPGAAAHLYQRLSSAHGLTIAVWLDTKTLEQDGPARIVSMSADTHHRDFTIGQDDDAVVWRVRTTKSGPNGMNPELEAPQAFVPGKHQLIVATADPRHYRIYVDGMLRAKEAVREGSFLNWDPSYPLIFGNEATGDRPWLGRIIRVAIYDAVLTEEAVVSLYDGSRAPSEDDPVLLLDFGSASEETFHDGFGSLDGTQLQLPQPYPRVPLREFLARGSRAIEDFAYNVTLFFVWGLLIEAWLEGRVGGGRRAITYSFALVAFLALTAEIVQFFSEHRTSSVYDLLFAVLGGVAGIAFTASGAFDGLLRKVR
jgi:hypothetical protein